MKIDVPALYKIFLKHPQITIDSRKVVPGSMFFALKGENFDGNRFASDALAKGAAYAVIDDESLDTSHAYHLV
ncbi:MAG: Mur ligase domain-containing protein, partial [Bacteroidota bacterium]